MQLFSKLYMLKKKRKPPKCMGFTIKLYRISIGRKFFEIVYSYGIFYVIVKFRV